MKTFYINGNVRSHEYVIENGIYEAFYYENWSDVKQSDNYYKINKRLHRLYKPARIVYDTYSNIINEQYWLNGINIDDIINENLKLKEDKFLWKILL